MNTNRVTATVDNITVGSIIYKGNGSVAYRVCSIDGVAVGLRKATTPVKAGDNGSSRQHINGLTVQA